MKPHGQRHTPPETPAVVDFQQFARFEHVDPTQNCARFYALALQPTLLGDVALVRSWGRIGTRGSSRSTSFPSRTHAQATIERLLRRRIQRRYELVQWT